MTWHYRARKRVGHHATYYDVVEVYDDGGQLSWTENGIDLIADTPEELATMCKMILHDIEERPAMEDDPS